MFLEKPRMGIAPLIFTALRVYVGIIMAVHGYEKFENIEAFAGNLANMGLPAPMFNAYAAIAGELLGGLGLIVGFLTPLAAFGVTAVMAVAVFKVHWANGLLASNRGFEYPLTLLICGIFFMINGAGPISLDRFAYKKFCTPNEE